MHSTLRDTLYPNLEKTLEQIDPTFAILFRVCFTLEPVRLAHWNRTGVFYSLPRVLIKIAERRSPRNQLLVDFLRFFKCLENARLHQLIRNIPHLHAVRRAIQLIDGLQYSIAPFVHFGRFVHSWSLQEDGYRAVNRLAGNWMVIVHLQDGFRTIAVTEDAGKLLSSLSKTTAQQCVRVGLERQMHALIRAGILTKSRATGVVRTERIPAP